MSVQAYPLQWPDGRPRTPAQKRSRARFAKAIQRYSSDGKPTWKSRETLSVGHAKRRIYDELERFDARNCVISANLVLNLDGTPRSGQKEPDDPGVAVYFTDRRGAQCVMACDAWDRAADNMAAIAKHIDSIRGQVRWGVVAADEAFRGFAALPPPDQSWRSLLGFNGDDSPTHAEIDAAYRIRASKAHPDHGGDAELFAALTTARERAHEAMPG